MGSVIDLRSRRQPRRPTRKPTAPRGGSGQQVQCVQCGERHPIVRLKTGESRCVSAFFDGTHWFCLHGGCRREWLSRHGGPT